MKFLARMMMVLALLGVLAYGSFAFGKYVLSAKLFGDNVKSGNLQQVSRSTSEASAITRQTGWKGAKPRVDVKVLPADQTGAGPALPAYPDEDGFDEQLSKSKNSKHSDSSRSVSSSDSSSGKTTVKRNVDSGSVEYSLGGENGTRSNNDNSGNSGERRKRKRRKRNSSNNTKTKTTVSKSSTPDNARSESTPPGDGQGEDDAISVTKERTPTRERTPERAPKRTKERPRRETTSPVPRPESQGNSGGGGDSGSISPVPQPE